MLSSLYPDYYDGEASNHYGRPEPSASSDLRRSRSPDERKPPYIDKNPTDSSIKTEPDASTRSLPGLAGLPGFAGFAGLAGLAGFAFRTKSNTNVIDNTVKTEPNGISKPERDDATGTLPGLAIRTKPGVNKIKMEPNVVSKPDPSNIMSNTPSTFTVPFRPRI